MAAHLRKIWEIKCQRCSKRATVRLHSTYNEPIAEYCGTCGPKVLKEYLAKYQEQDVAERQRMNAARGGE